NRLVHFQEVHAYVSTLYRSEFFEVVYDFLYQVNRNGKTITGIYAGRRRNSGINTDQFSLRIYQCPATVTFVNYGVSLDEGFHGSTNNRLTWLSIAVRRLALVAQYTNLSSFRTDDTSRNCRLKAKRISNR